MNTTKHTGGPAFPSTTKTYIADDGDTMHQGANGMTLRDYFAAKAMQGMCAQPDTWGLMVPQIAERAYVMADAMLRARGAA
ncbi:MULTISPECIES: hypothetical protein [Burkholderia]|uniref:hypothetical protein n=1 Tax=Burkholderia TaxID=32008 RepID=UPI00086B26F2|nr:MULTISPECIES: hypothetical protein [Burkholderia]MDP9549671.1 hypothetical protein [Burkholderia cepacia]MBR8393378.1 hypothetical protein [Burkholderia cenocepacia]MBR8473297.1 hypothetical protein [Burkholderia cenocepacia]MBR8491746.1 hypothetical protein [Burkholderia cenocepacia]MDO5919717.1 hypothetical protein [Burkholderia cenocepacia]